MTTTLDTVSNAGVHIDHQAILKSLNLNPSDPKTQALLLVCDRYGLDPLLKHAVLIQGTLYVTRDGLLAVAHRSGQFDGIEVIDEGDDGTHWWAKVSVYRRDMGRPFTYRGRYPKAGGNKGYGPEMAVKCGEVMALRRAFNVTGVPAAEERWDVDHVDEPAPAPVVDVARRRPSPLNPAPVQPPTMVAARDAKRVLLDEFTAAGISPEGARSAAAALWGDRGSNPIDGLELAALVADIASLGDGGGDAA